MGRRTGGYAAAVQRPLALCWPKLRRIAPSRCAGCVDREEALPVLMTSMQGVLRGSGEMPRLTGMARTTMGMPDGPLMGWILHFMSVTLLRASASPRRCKSLLHFATPGILGWLELLSMFLLLA